MASFGEELKRERELREISLREVAEATKVNIRYLEAMERNDFRHLPGGVFNRGFVRAYAQYIGVDPEAMVNAYLLEKREQDNRDRSPDERWMRGRRDGPRDTPRAPKRRLSRWIWIALLFAILALAGALLYGLISGGRGLGAATRGPSGTEQAR